MITKPKVDYGGGGYYDDGYDYGQEDYGNYSAPKVATSPIKRGVTTIRANMATTSSAGSS